MRLRGERLQELAQQVRDVGLRAGGRVVARADADVEATLEARVRDLLTKSELATETAIAEALGLPVKAVRPVLKELADQGKLASVKRGRERVYAWLFPDGRGDAPVVAPRSEGMVRADVRREAAMIDVDRGKPVRLVTSNRDRRARSTPGVRHKMKLKDAAYERQEEAKARRAEEQRAKAAQTPPRKGK